MLHCMETQIIHAFWAEDFLSLHYLFTLQASSSFSYRGSCWKKPWQQRVPGLNEDGHALNARCVGGGRSCASLAGGGTDNLAELCGAGASRSDQCWEIQSLEQSTFRLGQCLEWSPLKIRCREGLKARPAAAWGQLGP